MWQDDIIKQSIIVNIIQQLKGLWNLGMFDSLVFSLFIIEVDNVHMV